MQYISFQLPYAVGLIKLCFTNQLQLPLDAVEHLLSQWHSSLNNISYHAAVLTKSRGLWRILLRKWQKQRKQRRQWSRTYNPIRHFNTEKLENQTLAIIILSRDYHIDEKLKNKSCRRRQFHGYNIGEL